MQWGSTGPAPWRSASGASRGYGSNTCSPVPPPFSDALVDEFTEGLALNGRHLEAYLSTYFSPNTHLLGEAAALFFIGLLVPETTASARWQRHGWRIVVQQSSRQVLPDGLHFERSAYYHVYALDFFLHTRILAERNGIREARDLDGALNRQLDVLDALSVANGAFRFGDDDGGRVFDGARNREEHLLDPLATGAALFERPELKASAGGLKEETVWLLGEDGVRRFDELSEPLARVPSRAFKASKMYVLAAGDPVPRKVLFGPGAATELGGGHAHADLLSVQLALGQTILLDDSGTFVYVGAEEWRDRFRGTEAHSTLQVGQRSQGLPVGPFSWESLPEPTTELCVSGDAFDLVSARHDYHTGAGTRLGHSRCVFSLDAGFVLVRDAVCGDGSHRLDLRWNLAPAAELLERQPGAHVVAAEGRPMLALVACADSAWEADVDSGWASPAYGHKEPRSVLRFSREAEIPTDFVTLMQPISERGDGWGCLGRLGDSLPGQAAVAGYRYELEEQTHFFFFARGGSDWQLIDWKSDASFLYCRMSSSGRRISEAIIVEGSYVQHGRERHAAPDACGDHWTWQG